MRASIPRGSPVSDRIRALSEMDSNGCWIWQARIDRHGYGHIDECENGWHDLPSGEPLVAMHTVSET